MVEVFKTNVYDKDQAEKIISKLLENFPEYEVNFDLHDCDNILRVKASEVNRINIISTLKSNGFDCSVLPD